MTLTPAYGRDYKSAKAATADFDANKDFILNDITSRWNGKPANKSDLAGSGIITIRYNRLRDTTTVTV